MLRSKLILPGLALALAGGAFAQGDDCSTATAINTNGAFAFDTSALTTTGFDGTGACANGGSATINQDGFWQWTAPAAGDYTFDTIGSGFDTKLSVHTGIGCAAVCADYNDDTFGLQSEVSLSGVAMGDMVLIQVGGFGSNSGIGTLNINVFTPPAVPTNDDCSTAIAVNALGSSNFDSTLATTSAFDGGGTCAAGAATLGQDVFYQFTVPANGDYVFDTAGTVFDTQLSVHTGIGCAATCTDYNDDAIGVQSKVTLAGLVTGDMVLVQVGGYLAAAGAGVLNISLDPCAGMDDSYEENDDCSTAAAVSDGTITGLFASATDPDHYSTCVDDGATIDIDILFIDAQADMDLFLWDAADFNCGTGFGTTDLANGFSVSDNETISWTNTTGADLDVIIEVHLFSGDCNTYDLVVAGSGTCDGTTNAGTPFCDPANLNSTGMPAVLSGTFGTGIGSDLHLEMTDGVPGQLAYMLAGNMATMGIPVSNGQFCLVGAPGAAFFRFNVGGTDMNSIGGFDPSGTYINVSGTSTTGFGFDVPSNIPSGVPIPIMAGDTWHFQGWYRDTPAASGSSNFTNGLSVTF